MEVIENTTEVDETFYTENFADYYNQLVNFKFIPHTTVQEIAERNLKMSKSVKELQGKKLRECLDGLPMVSEREKVDLHNQVIEDDVFLSAQMKLSTEFKRSKFIRENMKYVAPREIILNKDECKHGAKKDVIHYIPISESLKLLLEDDSFNRMMSAPDDLRQGGDYRDIKDGTSYKTNAFFIENPNAYALLLYSDGVEMKNPLGAARGTYKVVQIFWTLGAP